jgi:hypothetical protein
MNRKISIQLQGKRHIPFEAGDHEGSITWTLRVKQAPAHIPAAWSGTYGIVELAASGTRKGKPFWSQPYHLTRRSSRCETSLRATQDFLLQLARDR